MSRVRLSDATPGTEVVLYKILGGMGMERKLTEMGLLPGEKIQRVDSPKDGPVILIIKGAKVAIGQGMAKKIIVEECIKKKKIKVALAGNPNSGKTSIFNNLTGARQHIGNYPGVTVEKKEGITCYDDYTIEITDLPGVYSLTAYSLDEVVARDFILNEKPDIVVNIVDASNLERNLYLSTQLMEFGVPLVLAFNMSDITQSSGQRIDDAAISELLGVSTVYTIGNKDKGTKQLLGEIVKTFTNKTKTKKAFVNYGREVEEEISKITALLQGRQGMVLNYPKRWLAVKLLENDKYIVDFIKSNDGADDIIKQAEAGRLHIKTIFADDTETILADKRYGFINGILHETITQKRDSHLVISDNIDYIVANRILGIPIFLGVMWLMFKAIFSLSEKPMQWIEQAQGAIGNYASGLLPEGSLIQGLVVDGIIGGVGSVLVFVPIIFLLFFFMSILEDSGYMARIAFIIDKFMHKIGLHGRSFIPMLLGFGCNVPAIMATRVIESRKDRFTTILINPFMSCGARLPVYTLLIGAFFSERMSSNILFSLYILGFLVAVIMAKVFRRFVFTGESAPFVMELPPYRIPTLKGLVIHMWERGWLYIKKAGTVIMLGCIIIWSLSALPLSSQGDIAKSYIGKMGKVVEPVVRPLGFDWKIGTALIAGVVAKEIVVGTLGVLYGADENADESSLGLREALRRDAYPDGRRVFSPLIAYALMVFVLLYIPCLSTAAVIRKETGSWGWMFFSIGYSTALAWIASFIIYQGGRLFGL
jgi:ferrous iron transport protein B